MSHCTLAITNTFIIMQCPSCGCHFALPEQRYSWYVRGIGSGETVYCPNGHGMSRTTPAKTYEFVGTNQPIVFIADRSDQFRSIEQAIIDLRKSLEHTTQERKTVAPVATRTKRVTCQKCGRSYKNNKSLYTHKRTCKGKDTP
jgi:adenine-specific DNA methylase